MLGGISDTLGDLAGALGDAQAGDACTGKPTFSRGASIDPESTGEAHGHALQDVMVADAKPIEYVHFGRVHSDDGTRFPHAEFADDASVDLPGDGDARAAMFRAGLLRETLLLAGFVGSTSDVMAEYDASQGSLGDVVDAASSLMGGGGAGTAAPDAAGELGRILSDIGAAGGQAAVPDIAYEPVHTAGVDLHQARADHAAFCTEHLEPYYVTKDGGGGGGGGGLMGTVGDLVGPLPGVGDVMGTVTGIIFKAFDIYVAMYLLARKPMEPIIADASYRLTIRQIRARYTPVFHPWFKRPPPSDDGSGDGDGGGGGGGGGGPTGTPLDDVINPVTNAIDTVESEIDSAKQSFEEFFGIPPEPTFGDADLAAALTALDAAGAEYLAAFRTVLGFDLPDFVKRLIEELVALNVESLKRITGAIHQQSGATPISEAALLQLGRESMYHRILRILADLVPFLDMLSNPDKKFLSLGSTDIGAAPLVDKALKELDGAIGPGLDHVIKLTMTQLAAKLEDIRKRGKGDNAITMEIYLGRLPYLLTLMTRNTVFPVWELLVKHVFGNLSGVLDTALSPMDSMLSAPANALGDAQSEVDELNDKITNVTDAIPTSVDESDIAAFAADPEGAIEDALAGDPTNPLGGDEGPAPPPAFPGSRRASAVSAADITAADAGAVEPVQVVDPTPPAESGGAAA